MTKVVLLRFDQLPISFVALAGAGPRSHEIWLVPFLLPFSLSLMSCGAFTLLAYPLTAPVACAASGFGLVRRVPLPGPLGRALPTCYGAFLCVVPVH